MKAGDDMPQRQRPLAGTGGLIRLILRRDRVRIPLWIFAVVGFTVSFLPSLTDLFPDERSRQARAALIENPATLAMTGPGYGIDDYTYGAMVSQEFFLYSALIVAFMSVLLIVRHTRAEEETGRAELIRAAAVGRHAGLAAAVTVVVAVNLVIAALLTLLMPATLDALPVYSTFVFACALASVGIAFTGVGVFAAQLTYSSRAANGYAVLAIGIAVVARAVGDASYEWLSWLSPIGWAQQTAPYVHDRWWPLAIAVGFGLCMLITATRMARLRDLGAGMMAPRIGPKQASTLLRGPFTLAWKLQFGAFIAWTCGLALFASLYGSLAPEIQDFVDTNEFAQQMFTGEADPLAGFMSMIVVMLALLAGGYVLQSTLRMRGEETAARAEPLLAAAVPRWAYTASHLAPSLLGGPVMLMAATAVLGATTGATTGEWGMFGEVLAAATVYIPVLWLLSAGACALFGWAPKLIHLVWIVLAYGATISLLGMLLDLPDWAFDLSIFEHPPQWPDEDLTPSVPIAMTAGAVALCVLGIIGFRRRDTA